MTQIPNLIVLQKVRNRLASSFRPGLGSIITATPEFHVFQMVMDSGYRTESGTGPAEITGIGTFYGFVKGLGHWKLEFGYCLFFVIWCLLFKFQDSIIFRSTIPL